MTNMNDAIIFYPQNTQANVYYTFKNPKLNTTVYLVKVSINDIGVYINSITVQPSAKQPDELWVQSPRFNIRGRWVWPIQMQKDSPLWKLIEKLALEAVAEYSGESVDDVQVSATDGAFVEREVKFL